jgi:lysophospholipid acyltransferase (LPLAT)-like uncharacterized protein
MKRLAGNRPLLLAARLLLRGVAMTWRIREEIPDDCRAILDGREVGLVAFWHGGMLPVWYRFRGGDRVALISASGDGEILANYLHRSLGYSVIRGSSSRGGKEALDALVRALGGHTCLITPDGPQGPPRKAKAGVLVASARSGRPVLLAGWRARRSWHARSWDSMEVPYPFSRIDFRYCRLDSSEYYAGFVPPSIGADHDAESERGDRKDQGRFDDETLGRFSGLLSGLSQGADGE